MAGGAFEEALRKFQHMLDEFEIELDSIDSKTFNSWEERQLYYQDLNRRMKDVRRQYAILERTRNASNEQTLLAFRLARLETNEE